MVARPVTRFLRPAPSSHLEPVSRNWGFDRGTPIARYFIDQFIASHASDIKGDVLEIKSLRYADEHASGEGRRDVLDINASNPRANIIADIAKADHVSSDSYDCIILTETLQYVFDLIGAAKHCHRILKPGGVMLVSVPSISPVDAELAEIDCWRFNTNACWQLFSPVFGERNVEVKSYGNFATSISGLSGVAMEEVPKECLEKTDPIYTQGILVRVVKR